LLIVIYNYKIWRVQETALPYNRYLGSSDRSRYRKKQCSLMKCMLTDLLNWVHSGPSNSLSS